jgi:hypothetical protein
MYPEILLHLVNPVYVSLGKVVRQCACDSDSDSALRHWCERRLSRCRFRDLAQCRWTLLGHR